MNRHDMLVELVSDQINSIKQMIQDDEYDDVHNWLHPILLREMRIDCADLEDDDLKNYYCDTLGVDIPSSPPLSSEDEEEEEESLKPSFPKGALSLDQEAPDYRPLSIPPGMELSTLSHVCAVSDEKGLAEMAATLRSIVCREETVHGLKPTTEVRIPMCLLLRLVHGKDCFG